MRLSFLQIHRLSKNDHANNYIVNRKFFLRFLALTHFKIIESLFLKIIDQYEIINIYTCALFFLTIITILDLETNNCIKNKTYKSCTVFHIMFFHHFINTFAHFGFLAQSKLMLIFLYFFRLHWSINNRYCRITQYTNKLCHHDESTPFHDVRHKRFKI